MTRVLAAPTVVGGPRPLTAARPDQLDPVVRQLVEEARAEGHRTGLEQGRRQGRAAAVAELEHLSEGIRGAVAEVVEQARAATDEAVDAAMAFGLAVAEVVLGREPHDGGEAVARAARAALDDVDDPAPVLSVHPDDRAVVTRAVADLPTVEVRADESLAPGEARLRGTWAHVDLTSAARLDAIRRHLHGDG